MKDTTHAARPMKYTRHQWKTHGGNKTQHRAIETHPGNPDAGCEDLCGAINGYLIVPTPASDELRWTANRNILTPLSFILNILSEIYLLDIYFKKETDIWLCWPSPVMSSPYGASVNRWGSLRWKQKQGLPPLVTAGKTSNWLEEEWVNSFIGESF